MHNHKTKSKYIKDIVYGANDGIVTTFAVIAASVGASFNAIVILVIGFANLIADGFSMASSDYLGSRSEQETYKKEKRTELHEITQEPKEEVVAIEKILREKGYSEEEVKEFAKLVSKNKNFWADIMLGEELGFSYVKTKPIKSALVTFWSFIGAGLLPLLPYVFLGDSSSAFRVAVFSTAFALFLVGSLRSLFSGKKWFYEGMEMLIVGGIAATIAYLVSIFVRGAV